MEEKVLQDFKFSDYSDIEIEFTIKTKLYDLNQLSDILKIDPTRGFSVGESYEGKQLNTDTRRVETAVRQRPYTLWVFNTNTLTGSDKFEDHAKQLINILTPHLDRIELLLVDKDNFEIIVFIYLTIDKEAARFGFGSTSPLFKQLADLSHYIEWRTR